MSRQSLLTTSVKAILANKLYIPISAWHSLPKEDRSTIIKFYTQKHNNPFNCFIHTTNRKCHLKEKFINAKKNPIIACFNCKNSEERVVCISKTPKYVKMDIGNKQILSKVISVFRSNGIELQVEDRTVLPKLKTPWDMDWIRLDKEKSREQERLAKLWYKSKNGMLIAPPRFGKSLLTAFIGKRMKTRILILVHKIDLARQFLKDWTTFTTIPKDKISINPDIKTMKTNFVSICTYQQFVNNDEKLKAARKLFGFIIVDEVHKAAANKYYEVVTAFYAKYRLGVTATSKRRDNKQFRNEHAFGPILAEGGSEQLSCDYVYTDTNWKCEYKLSSDAGWTHLWERLSKDPERNALVAEYAVRDVMNGHRIMIPLKRHTHLKNLYDLIKKQAKKQGLELRICQYHGELPKNKRRELQEDIYKGKYDIVIGTDSIISLGFNAPPMSCVYINVHTYRSFAPDLYQEYSRIRTKCDYIKKKKPLIRIFRDYGNDTIDKSMSVIDRELKSKSFEEIFENDTSSDDNNSNNRSKRGLRKLF